VSDIFREVDEEIRHERYAQLWKRYGIWVIGAALALVLGVAGYQGWQAYQRHEAQNASDRFAAAMTQAEQGNTEAAMTALGELAESGGGGYGLLAAFRRAELQVQAGDTAAAVATWNSLATNADTPEPYASMARLFAVMHRMDEGDPAKLDSQLAGIAEGDSPFRSTALELRAILAEKQGDRARAISLYKQIADGADVPPQQRQRATQMLSQLEG
jgi:hypothetical protein